MIQGYLEKLDTKFGTFEQRLDTLEHKVDTLGQKFDELDTKFNKLDTKFNELDAKFDRMSERMTEVAGDISHLKSSFTGRFEVTGDHLKLIEREQARFDQRVSKVEERLYESDIKSPRLASD
jgi:chromosome segregation ATPase